MVDGRRVDAPVALGKLPELHRVVAHGGQAVAAGLPGQQHLPGLDFPLGHRGAAGGLGPGWEDPREGERERRMMREMLGDERRRLRLKTPPAHFSPPPTGVVTSLLSGDHQSLGGLAPALPGLRRDAEHVDRLRFQAGHRVLAGAGVEHVHGGRVAVGGVVVVGDLVGWGREEGQT